MDPLAAEIRASTALTLSSHHVSLAVAGAPAPRGRVTGTTTGSGGKRHHSLDAQLDELGACRSKLRAVVGDDPLDDVAGDAAEVLGKGTSAWTNAAQCCLCVCERVSTAKAAVMPEKYWRLTGMTKDAICICLCMCCMLLPSCAIGPPMCLLGV